ncbi:MAG TPA: hypothetical protein VIW46_08390 [Acidimicrobiia bacterium]|jgi:hypothetical protein
MSDIAARGAVEIDRLVLGINRQVGSRHGADLMTEARELGLESLKLVPHLGEFWLQRPVPLEFAEARLPYAEPGSIAERIDLFESLGLLARVEGGHIATERFRALLKSSIRATERVIVDTWSGLEALVDQADPLVARVVGAASAAHVVAAVHRGLEPPTRSLHRFYWRLVTLRFIRQHDHIAAWQAVGLDSRAIALLTALWLGNPPPDDGLGRQSLEDKGLISGTTLTGDGQVLRDAIEADTNRRAGMAWSALAVSEAEQLVALLEALPSSQQ